MKSSNTQKRQPPRKPPTKAPPPKGSGAGYKLGPRAAKPVSVDAVWITSNQVCQRYGGRSHMWLFRNIKNIPDFPKPTYFGRMQLGWCDEN
jgi:predicted DNA-binding transcriptional regulator AlpA